MTVDRYCVIVLHSVLPPTSNLIYNHKEDFRLCIRCSGLAFRHVGDRCAYSPLAARYSAETQVFQIGTEVLFVDRDKQPFGRFEGLMTSYVSYDALVRDYLWHKG